MDISIGSNQLRNTNGIFTADDQTLIALEINETDGSLLLSMDLYNPAGSQVGKLERNTWTSNDQERFELKANNHSVMLIDNTLKGVVLLAKKEGDSQVLIPQAKFYLPGGVVSEVTAEQWHVGNKMELKNVEVDMSGGAIEIQ